MAAALLMLGVAHTPDAARAEGVPLCQYLWGVTPQQACGNAFRSTGFNSMFWMHQEFAGHPKWFKYMLTVNPDTVTLHAEAYYAGLKERLSVEDCKCEMSFSCRRTVQGILGEVGGSRWDTRHYIYKCDLSVRDIRKLTVRGVRLQDLIHLTIRRHLTACLMTLRGGNLRGADGIAPLRRSR